MNSRTVTSLPVSELPVATGNWDTSRSVIDRIIIHTMDGTVQGASARFDNPSSQVSAHYGVGLDGTLYHWVDENKTAYHSGDYPTNQRSIGIEHEDGGDYNGVRPDVLYGASAKLVADICHFYQIPCNRTYIRKHNEVSDQPTACPDALDIDRIVREASALLNPSTPPIQSPVFSDQTLIPVGGDFGQIELQRVRGLLGDLKTAQVDLESNKNQVATLSAEVAALQLENTSLKAQLSGAAPIQPTPTSPETPPQSPPSPSAGQSLLDFLRKLFRGGDS